jgi:monolysocardiolipin acyltransferase
LDDPGLMSALFPWSWNLSAARHRWSAAAEDICFTKPWHTFFFSLGKTFPVVRGLGIHQPAMDFALELLKCNEYLHIFPQGRVVEDPDLDLDLNGLSKLPINEQVKQVTLRDGDFNKDYQLKWGIARVILDYLSTNPSPEKHILILPFFHIGMHHVLPNVEPYVPRTGNTVTVSVREAGPIKFDLKFLNALFKNDEISTKEQRSRIMAYIEYELKMLKLSTMKYRHAILDDSTKR